MSDIVEWLLQQGEWTSDKTWATEPHCAEAAEEITRLRAENEQLKNMINLYDEMVAVLLPSWEVGSDDDEKAEYMITYTNIKKAFK